MTLAIAVGCVHVPRAAMLGRQPYVFWPPPPATSLSEESLDTRVSTMGDAAAALASRLRDAGYVNTRWYPIGARYEHGFAVTTRLERLDGPSSRWPALYPEPVELRWLAAASPLVAGHFCALLIAFTDLPATASEYAPTWDATTVMETGTPPSPVPAARPIASTFRVATFVYEYEQP